jgi:hypothetical protein
METSRRSFLGGLAVATALSSAAAAQAIATSPNDDADLLRLGTEFDAIHDRFLVAASALPAFQAAYRSITPDMPNDLISRQGEYAWSRGFTDYAEDPACPARSYLKDHHGSRLNVVQAYRIEAKYGARFEKPEKAADFTEAGDMDIYLHEVAQRYEAAVQAALISSGLGNALADYREAMEALRTVIWALCAVRAKTPAGVALKVRATAAFASLGSEERFTASQMLSKAIWEDMGEDA